MATATLLNNETATGTAITTLGGGQYIVTAESAGWNGATFALHLELANGTYVAVTDASLTANGSFRVYLPNNKGVQAVISAAVPSSGVYADMTLVST